MLWQSEGGKLWFPEVKVAYTESERREHNCKFLGDVFGDQGFEDVAHLFVLGLHVFLECLLGLDFGGDAFGDCDAAGFEGCYFFWIIGDEANGGYVEELEHFGGELKAAAVGRVAEFLVGFDSVAAVILEFVGSKLGHEADAAALLLFVEEDASSFVADFAEGEFELQTAVAAQ